MKKILSYIGIVIVASLFFIYVSIRIGALDMPLFGFVSSTFIVIPIFIITLVFCEHLGDFLERNFSKFFSIYLVITIISTIGYKYIYESFLFKKSTLKSFIYDFKKENGKIVLSNGKVLNLHKIENSNLLQTKDKITECLKKNQNVFVSYKSNNTSFRDRIRDRIDIYIECFPKKNIN